MRIVVKVISLTLFADQKKFAYKIKSHIHVDIRHEISLETEDDYYSIVEIPLKIYSHPQSFSVSVGFFL